MTCYTYKCEDCGYEFYSTTRMVTPFYYHKPHVKLPDGKEQCNGKFFRKYDVPNVIIKGKK
jgi:hypothetical protein